MTEKLLDTYRQLQDRYADPQFDELGRDRVIERLELKLCRACFLYPWTPHELYEWTAGWLHLLAFGAEKRQRTRYRRGHFVNAWSANRCLAHPDVKTVIAELDDRARERACAGRWHA